MGRVFLVALLLGAVTFGLRDDDPSRSAPRYAVIAGAAPWLQVRALTVTDALGAPAGAGPAQEVVAGPGGRYVVVAGHPQQCVSRLYRFRLTGDGRVRDLAEVPGGPVQGTAGGVAFTQDGRRVAYASMLCSGGLSLVVHDLTTGRRRSWDAAPAALLGGIVWAGDHRTLGAVVTSPTGDVTVHALDTTAAGTDVRAARVLLDAPASAGAVGGALMDLDGRSGTGFRRAGSGTDFIAFAAGAPVRVTGHSPDRQPTGNVMAIGTSISLTAPGEPRFACLNGLDAFGRRLGREGFSRCTVA